MRALPQGVPGLPTSEGIKNFLEYDIKIPLQIKEDIPPERLLSCNWSKKSKKNWKQHKGEHKMTSEKDLREQLATCTRIFAMQGMIGVFGHVSVYQPETKTVLITPGMGSDKGSLRPEDMVPTDLDGKPLEGKEGPPVEWPIHTAIHGARADALAVAHLHTPYATLFAIAKREFRPVTLQGAIFSDGVPLYPEAQLITNPARGNALLKVIGDKRAALLRGHGIVVVGQNLQEVLFSAWSWKMTPRNPCKPQRWEKSARSARRSAAPSAPRSRWSGAPKEHGIIFVVSKRAGIASPQRAEASFFRKSDKYRSNGSTHSSRSNRLDQSGISEALRRLEPEEEIHERRSQTLRGNTAWTDHLAFGSKRLAGSRAPF